MRRSKVVAGSSKVLKGTNAPEPKTPIPFDETIQTANINEILNRSKAIIKTLKEEQRSING